MKIKLILTVGLAVLMILLVYGTYNFYTTTQETITVGYLLSNHDSALFVADAMGYFQKTGIKVRIVPFRSGYEIIEATNKNMIDIGYCGITPITTAISKNASIKIVAAVNQEGSGIVVSKKDNITKVIQMEGKKFSIPKKGGIQDVLYHLLLRNNNINTNDVNITELEAHLMLSALQSGKINGYIVWEPYVSQASSHEEVFMYSKDIWPHHPCCVVIATDKFIKEKPEQLRTFLKVHVEATDYVNTHKNETAKILRDKLGTNLTIEQNALKDVEFIAIPTPEFENNINKLIEIQIELGYLENNLT